MLAYKVLTDNQIKFLKRLEQSEINLSNGDLFIIKYVLKRGKYPDDSATQSKLNQLRKKYINEKKQKNNIVRR